MVKGFPFEVPKEYADLPQLKVRSPAPLLLARLSGARGRSGSAAGGLPAAPAGHARPTCEPACLHLRRAGPPWR